MWQKCEELNKLVKARVTDDKLEKTENEIALKMDEKLGELRDRMERDRIDVASKLSVVKSEFAVKTFDTDTFDFLKNRVRFEWPTQMTKVNENDRKLAELLGKHEVANNLLTKTITKLKQGNTLDDEESELNDDI